MSDNEPESGQSSKTIPPIPPECDITSEQFDPLVALYSENVQFAQKNVKIYDNVSAFESAINKSRTQNPQSKRGDKTIEAAEPITRRFLPHQGLVKGHGQKAKTKRNIIKKLEEGFQGPLALLTACMKNKNRVKIYIRKEHGILGHITGVVEAFDKHWNIALSDVNEVWKRRKTYLCDTADYGPAEDCTERLKELNISLPDVKVKSINRRYVECSRNVPQLLVRGEQVAVIIVLKDEKDDSDMKEVEKEGKAVEKEMKLKIS